MNDFSSNMNTTEKVIQFAEDTGFVCCGTESGLHEKVKEFFQKTEECVEMNKLTLNTNETELTMFSRNSSDFGSVFLNTKFPQHKKLADILVFKFTGTLFLMSS